jgi:hypothetical protein
MGEEWLVRCWEWFPFGGNKIGSFFNAFYLLNGNLIPGECTLFNIGFLLLFANKNPQQLMLCFTGNENTSTFLSSYILSCFLKIQRMKNNIELHVAF